MSTADGSARADQRDLTLLLGFVFFCAVFGDRLLLPVSVLGSDALPLVPLIAPVVAIVTVWRVGGWRSLGFLHSPSFVVLVLPWVSLTIVLPIAGVLINDYGAQTLWDATAGTTALSFLIIGAAASRVQMRYWAPWLLLSLGLELAYSLGQAAFISGAPIGEVFAPLAEWDLTFRGPGADVLSRSTGLFNNPNELGSWAAVAAMMAVAFLSPSLRPVGIVAAIVTLLLSQARGATVATVFGIGVGAVLAIIGGRLTKASFRSLLVTVLVVAVIAPIVLVLVSQGDALQRFAALASVLFEGAEGDANLAGRFDLWSGVLELSADYPLGTWGPPGVALGTSIDSAWFAHFAQGSILFVVAFAMVMLAPFTIDRAPQRHGLWLVATVIIVISLTQNPLGEPVVIVFWTLLGAGLQSQVEIDAMMRSADGVRIQLDAVGQPPDTYDGTR